MIGTFASWWRGLGVREQRILAFGAIVVAAVVLYVALWEPAADGMRKLQVELPQLRAQGASMQAMADEVTRLRGAGATPIVVALNDREAAVRRSLDRAGLSRGSSATPVEATGPVTTLSTGGIVVTAGSKATGTSTSAPEVITEPNGRVRVKFANVDYGVWVGWLATTEIELSARASQVAVVALAPDGPVGHVRTDVLLDWGGAAGTPAR